jgi:hypothetical protein
MSNKFPTLESFAILALIALVAFLLYRARPRNPV